MFDHLKFWTKQKNMLTWLLNDGTDRTEHDIASIHRGINDANNRIKDIENGTYVPPTAGFELWEIEEK